MIKRALDKGMELVLMSARFGNWELSTLSFARKYYVVLIVVRQSNDFVGAI
jgi:lauroyl/myristoyl acyltransferase